jgi:hypothetical protein
VRSNYLISRSYRARITNSYLDSNKVTGAAVLAGKGIGKGVTSGDGRVILGGFADGAKSIGKGLGQGVSTTVIGSADGVLTAGKGLLSGAKNLGRGFGGVFLGGKKKSTNK